MKILKIAKNLYQIELNNRQEAKNLLRIQLFQEFPTLQYKKFTNKRMKTQIWKILHQSIPQYLKLIQGYNLSSETFEKFLNKKFSNLSQNEKILIKTCNYFPKPFYVIGLYKNTQTNLIIHEICHALWFLYPTYRHQIEIILKKVDSQLFEIIKNLVSAKIYAENVILDEIQAYLISNPNDWNSLLPQKTIQPQIKALLKVYTSHIKRLKSKKSLKNPDNLLNKLP